MKRARITGTLRYDFQYFPVDLPDSIDIEDKDAVSDFIEGRLETRDIRSEYFGEIEYEIDEIEEIP